MEISNIKNRYYFLISGLSPSTGVFSRILYFFQKLIHDPFERRSSYLLRIPCRQGVQQHIEISVEDLAQG